MRQIILMSMILLSTMAVFSQKRYFTKTGNIVFSATTMLEDVDAVNKSVVSIFDASTGQMEFSVYIKSFEFKRSLMQDHFNENYMESDKYPRALFKGKIININLVDFKKNGSYTVIVKGSLDMHGVKRDVDATGTMKVAGESVIADAAFSILLSDYNISVPSLVKDKVAKTVNIKVNCNYSLIK